MNPPSQPGLDPSASQDAPLDLVVFAVAGRVCALRREAVRELLPLPRLWAPPGLPRPLDGFLNLGGRPVPVLALARLLGDEEEAAAADPAARAYHHLLLLHGPAPGPAPLALRVDRVLDVLRLPAGAARPVAEGDSLGGVVSAEVVAGERLLHLLEADRLLLARERAVLDSLTREAARRQAEWEAPA